MTGQDRLAMAVVGLVVVFGYVAAMVTLFLVPIPEGNKDPIMQMIGTVGTLAGLVVGYWYSSSRGSAAKTELLAAKNS